MPRIIGLTGNIACGKSFVGRHLLELGAERYIDADAIVHRLYESGQSIALQVAQAFGPTVLAADGSVDRKALGAIVFNDRAALQRLERIVHPAVSVALQQELALVSASGIAVIDAVKLLEAESGKLCQSKWLVICAEEEQLKRLMARDGFSLAEARARITAQPVASSKYALVDEILDNSASLQEIRQQTAAAFKRFCQKSPS